MLALSVRQPWAWLIVHGPKNIENRTQRAHYRGPLLIHASKGMTQEEYQHACEYAEHYGVMPPAPGELVRGALIGRAKLSGVLGPSQNPHRAWHMPNAYGWVLDDREPLERPVPWRGNQGLFQVPPSALDSEASVRARVELAVRQLIPFGVWRRGRAPWLWVFASAGSDLQCVACEKCGAHCVADARRNRGVPIQWAKKHEGCGP